ncbi:MAG TPA: PadR family transcriptional regulator [Stackebrandtia sp.]|jgi:DNA-binding PadR family transcriptional regulator|uniref:PadR family transcriptional regulator n=1 Tax=Stackebrandtia sp. TaxID=2023065 RepID=UPI002D45FC30|nr:PadR family transcriptional regulator [Stackebrandtia sp.]HZE37546.1 PadR family transcriptional regulator [Stackebrandtia sp.]
MTARRKVANPLGLAVLAGLFEEPLHPYEMGRRLRERSKDRHVKFNTGTLYTVVGQLEKAGFIAASETIRDTARPDRTVYALTEAGREELMDWMRELIGEPRNEYPHFVAALSLLGVLAPQEARELLTSRVNKLRIETARNRAEIDEATALGLHWFHLVEEEYEVAVREAEIGYLTQLVRRLDDPELVDTWNKTLQGRQE